MHMTSIKGESGFINSNLLTGSLEYICEKTVVHFIIFILFMILLGRKCDLEKIKIPFRFNLAKRKIQGRHINLLKYLWHG